MKTYFQILKNLIKRSIIFFPAFDRSIECISHMTYDMDSKTFFCQQNLSETFVTCKKITKKCVSRIYICKKWIFWWFFWRLHFSDSDLPFRAGKIMYKSALKIPFLDPSRRREEFEYCEWTASKYYPPLGKKSKSRKEKPRVEKKMTKEICIEGKKWQKKQKNNKKKQKKLKRSKILKNDKKGKKKWQKKAKPCKP